MQAAQEQIHPTAQPARRLQVYLDSEKSPRQPLTIWEMPKDDECYSIGVDVAEGNDDEHSDETVATGVAVSTGVQVFEYASTRCDPIEAAFVVNRLGQFYGGQYGWALVVPEVITHGATMARVLIEHLNYPMVWRQRPYLKYDLSGNSQRGWFTNIAGWQPRGQARDLLINEAKAYFKNWPETARSPELLEQISYFRYILRGKDTSRQTWFADHPPNKKSDRLFAWMLALLGRNYAAQAMPIRKKETPRPMNRRDKLEEWRMEEWERIEQNIELQKQKLGRVIDPKVPIERWLF